MDSSQRNYPAAWLMLAFALLAGLLPCYTGVCAEPAKGPNAPPEFQLDKGFRLELVAAAPLVTSPVALAFDENGRLFVAEMPDASERGNAPPQAGRIRVLEDTNGDGTLETSRVYADNLPRPSALACYDGGLFVATIPDLLYLKSTRTNGPADSRKAFFQWFTGTNTPSAQALPNNFKWGLDNRFHGAMGGALETAPAANTPGASPAPLAKNGLSFDPRALAVAVQFGSARSGLSFDHRGRGFVCDLSHPLQMPSYDPRYMARNPFFAVPAEMFDVASPATAIFPLAGGQPLPTATNVAAVARTVAARQPAPAWLTNACGCLIYRGNAFPQSYLGNAFVCDPEAHLIHRMVLLQSGLVMVVASPATGGTTEFLVSKDASFHPTQIIDGPDGALYVADRQEGQGRGRIYRIVPANFKRPSPPRLGASTAYDLVATLSHLNGWYRDTAARLLYTRQDSKSVPLLAQTLAEATTPLARLHALHLLDGLGALNQTYLADALRDADDRVREHAVLLSEKLMANGALAGLLWNQLRAMAVDASPHVRYQLAFTLGEIRQSDRAQALAGILRQDPANQWVQAAVLSSAANGAGNLFTALAGDALFRATPVGQAFLQRLATVIGLSGSSQDAAQVLDFLDRARLDPAPGFAFLYALADGLHRAGSSLTQVGGQTLVGQFDSQAIAFAMNGSLGNPVVPDALLLLGLRTATFATVGDQLLLLVVSGQPEPVRSAAISALCCSNDPRIAPALIRRWQVLTPSLRHDAITALVARSDHIGDVLTAAESGQIPLSDFSSTQMDFLRTHRDSGVSRRALRLFGPVPVEQTAAVRQFTPALRLPGAARRGEAVFQARCAACHQLAGQGQSLGPDLVGARIYGKAHILAAVLEPNREIQASDLAYVVETGDGESLIGLLRNTNARTLTLRQPKGVAIVLPRANVPYLQRQTWSLMPVGLEAGLAPQDMADLLEYIMTAPR